MPILLQAKLNDSEMQGKLAMFLMSGCLVGTDGGRAWIGWGEPRRGTRSEKGRLSLYAPDFFLREASPWLMYERWANVSVEELIDGLEGIASKPLRSAWVSSSYEEFAVSFNDIQHRIANGTLVKAVPFIERRAPFEPSKAAKASLLAHALRRCQGQPLLPYGFWNMREGIVGTTPETLLEERPRRDQTPGLSTMALAGTRPPGGGSLLSDPKEMTEHRIVVEGIVERLAPLGRVVVGSTDELELPTLIHLHTPIEVVPDRPVPFEAWVAALHPTPAIGAWPKAAGWRWLLDQPNAERRGRYGAPFGFVPPDRETGTCLVAIRNVQWSDGEARLLAGGGIVAASRLEREWREFNLKLDSIAGAFGW